MSQVIITPSRLNGTVTIPPSKSDVHRAILCAALSRGKSVLSPVSFSSDIKATVSCIEALGAKTEYDGKTLIVDSTNIFTNKTAALNCGESGSALRFLIPIAAAGGVNATFTGQGLLPVRPIGIFLDTLPKMGVSCKTDGGLPLEIKGKLKSGTFEIPGNVSSQFITGLLLALPILNGDSKIVLTSPLQSVGYINMTIDTMKAFGVNADITEYGYFIKGNQKYTPCSYKTQGDWSQAAFFMAAGALHGEITVNGVDYSVSQGDKEMADILKRFGADVIINKNSIIVKKGNLSGITIDASQIPDLVPILAVTAAFAKGTTNIINAERLRIKESDRLNAIANALNRVGANVKEMPDSITITGGINSKQATIEGCNDHRIVMAMSIAGSLLNNKITITDAQSINKSYPNFFDDYKALGGNADVINMG